MCAGPAACSQQLCCSVLLSQGREAPGQSLRERCVAGESSLSLQRDFYLLQGECNTLAATGMLMHCKFSCNWINVEMLQEQLMDLGAPCLRHHLHCSVWWCTLGHLLWLSGSSLLGWTSAQLQNEGVKCTPCRFALSMGSRSVWTRFSLWRSRLSLLFLCKSSVRKRFYRRDYCC